MPATAFDFELRLDVSLAMKICATKFGVTCLHYVKQSTIFLRFDHSAFAPLGRYLLNTALCV